MTVTPMIYMGKFDPMSFLENGLDSGVSDFKKLQAEVPKNLTNTSVDEKIQVYKWRDEHGVMQFSNTPPPTAGGAELVELNPNSNVIQAVKVPKKEEAKASIAATTSAPAPYSIKGMKKVMNEAKGVGEMLQKRHQEQQNIMNNL
jgi:hypothetical protein